MRELALSYGDAEHGQRKRKNIFVKVSGDEFLNPRFQKWIKRLRKGAWVVICIGGGTQINTELQKRGYELTQHGPLGRETKTFEERQIARDVLERNQMEFEDQLDMMNVSATVIIPVLTLGGVLCHVNGDQMVRTAYVSYDKLYVITTCERLKKKRAEFADLPKVEVLAFPEPRVPFLAAR